MIEKRIHKGSDRLSILHFIGAVVLLLQVVACGGGGVSGGLTTSSSGGVGGGTITLPSGGPGTVALSWDANRELDVIGYRVYYGTSPGNYFLPFGAGIDVSAATSLTITGLTKGTRYYFAVTALDAAGNESPFSREVFKDIP